MVEPVAVTETSATTATVELLVTVLLVVSESGWSACTVPVTWKAPAAVPVAVNDTVADAPLPTVPKEQFAVVLATVHVPRLDVAVMD